MSPRIRRSVSAPAVRLAKIGPEVSTMGKSGRVLSRARSGQVRDNTRSETGGKVIRPWREGADTDGDATVRHRGEFVSRASSRGRTRHDDDERALPYAR